MDLYKSEANTRRIFDGCVTFAAKHNTNIGSYRNDATSAIPALTDAGCSIGQTWDTTGIRLNGEIDQKWRFAAPKEGALAWMDTAAVPAGAENIDQAYVPLNFLLSPEVGGMVSNDAGYNSAAVGAAAHLSEAGKAAFDFAYPGDAIANLWRWPMFMPWLSQLRAEDVERLTNA